MSSTQRSSVPAPRSAIYILSTHWDREWYEDFQVFRHRLVALLDEILEGFQSGEILGPLTLDGQTVVLEDYLEIRPAARDFIVRLAREGLICAGPWYVQPDEFLVSGESLIRNLELGAKTCRSFGSEPVRAGFVCDQFGHLGQLPQIFAGFGIDTAFLWRGLNPRKTGVVCWAGADGTKLRAYRFHGVGYTDYAHFVRRATESDAAPDSEDTRNRVLEWLDSEARRLEPAPVLIFDGGDHLPWDRASYAVVRELIENGPPNWRISHGSLDEYAEQLAQLDPGEMEEVSGELREPGVTPLPEDQAWLIPGVLSSRVPLKQRNAECEALLCHYAEPLAALASAALGEDAGQGFLDVAWKFLLQNHAHDSICGCSIDAVHKDMNYRFAQARRIARRVGDQALRSLALSRMPALGERERAVAIFNALPVRFEGIEILDLEIPADWPRATEFFGYEDLPAFELFDESGRSIPYQRIEITPDQTKHFILEGKFPKVEKIHLVRVAARIDVPAMGFAIFRIQSRPKPPEVPNWGVRTAPCRSMPGPHIATNPRCLDNGIVRAEVEADGSLTLTDLHSGEQYRNALVFEDSADIGDGWHHIAPVNDEVFSSIGTLVECAVTTQGPLVGALRLKHRIEIPVTFNFSNRRRSSERVALEITTTISLRRNSHLLEFHSNLTNTARDHRLRVAFGTGVPETHFFTDSAFDVVRRNVGCDVWPHDSREPEVDTKPQRSWSAIFDSNHGLAIVAPGLHEVAVADDPGRTLSLTLFRSNGKTVFTSGEPGGQLLEPLSFDYAVALGVAAKDSAGLARAATRIQLGARIQHFAKRGCGNPKPQTAPPDGLLEITGNAQCSAARLAGDTLEIRLFNPTPAEETVRLRFHESVAARLGPWHFTSLAGAILEAEPVIASAKAFTVTLGPKKIVTLRSKLPGNSNNPPCPSEDKAGVFPSYSKSMA